jgi:hypothetical protein
MSENLKPYDAIVWGKEPDAIGERVSVFAESAAEAKRKLQAIYGEDKVYYITNTEESSRPRQ